MKRYKHIDLPHMAEIQKAVLEKLDKSYFKTTIFKVCSPDDFEFPLLVEAVETIKPWNEVAHISVISQEPFVHKNNDKNVHKDVMSLTERGQEQPVCLNIPIYNCEETYVAIYKQLQDPYLYRGTYPNGHTWEAWHWRPGGVEEIDKLYLHKPALFYTQMPHGIINETKNVRIIISVRFSTPIDLETFEG